MLVFSTLIKCAGLGGAEEGRGREGGRGASALVDKLLPERVMGYFE